MSDFPKRNASFNPNAYRSQAAYDAHLKASRVNNDAHKPANTSNANVYRSPHVNNDAPKSGNAPIFRVDNGFPKPNNTFNPNGYRAQARVNTDSHKRGNAPTVNRNSYRNQATHNAYNNISRSNNNASKKQFQKIHKRQATLKTGTSGNEAVNTDEPHFMSDAEVRQWFREAEEDYERDKKAGRFDSYVPAGGHLPNFSDFHKKFDGSKAKVGGLEDSMHAPKKASDSEPAKPQGRK